MRTDGSRLSRRRLTVCLIAAFFAASGLLGAVPSAQPAAAATLDAVKARGLLRCGVINSGIGLSEIGATGRWEGFFPEFCRFLAAAVLGNADAVEFVEVNYVMRFDALNKDAFDVLSANTTWTTSRDADLNLAFTHPMFYDGQGFLAHDSLGAANLADAAALSMDRPLTVCVSEGTTTIQNLRDLAKTLDIRFDIVSFKSIENVYAAFFSRECELMTQDRVALVSQRLNRAPDPTRFVLFPEVISKEPLGPAVREDDAEWFDIVQWAVYASLLAEEHGLTRGTVDAARANSQDPEVRRLLGVDPGMGAMLGLEESWAYDALSQIGAYNEIFDRTLGADSSLGLERGLNALWTDGGLMYAPPMR